MFDYWSGITRLGVDCVFNYWSGITRLGVDCVLDYWSGITGQVLPDYKSGI